MASSDSVTVSKATDNDGPDIPMQLDEKMIYSSDNLLDNDLFRWRWWFYFLGCVLLTVTVVVVVVRIDGDGGGED
ncbi:hypothetical protein Hanom_Chr08g00731501 [Helianthus anomalus]